MDRLAAQPHTETTERSRRLDDLTASIAACRICRDTPTGKTLSHEPNPVVRASATARLAICGQAPGTRVHASGVPFTDRSGDRLRAWLNVDETTFYDQSRIAIVPMGFCFPGLDAKGGDLPPRRECRLAWHDQLFAGMPQIELILVIGQYAMDYHLGRDRPKTLTDTVADWPRHVSASGTPRVLPLPHPSWRNTAWLRKNPWFEQDLLPVLRDEVARLL